MKCPVIEHPRIIIWRKRTFYTLRLRHPMGSTFMFRDGNVTFSAKIRKKVRLLVINLLIRGSLMSESIWQHPRTGTNHNYDRGREVAITHLKRQHGKVHFTIKCRGVARVFINHTHKVGENVSF